MPIVPGTNPALQTWNGQFFVVADGSAQNRISLPFLQVNGGAATYIVGADNNGTLSYYSPIVETVKNLSGGFAGYLPYQSAANTTTFLPIGTSGQVLKVSNTGLPQWATPLAPTAQNITGGAAGEVVYQTAPSTTGFTAQGTTGQVLTSGGTGSPTWTTATNANTASAIVQRDASGNFSAGTITASLSGNATTASTATSATTAASATTATTATTTTNVSGGLAGSMPYQTAASTTTTLGIGSANQLLTVNTGGTAPIWQTGIIGVTDGSSAANGYVGQTVSGNLTFTGTTTGATVRSVEAIPINAGDWDIYGYVTFSYTGTTTSVSTIGASIGTSTTALTDKQNTILLVGATTTLTQANSYSFATPTIRVSVSATTNYYVVIKLPTFSAGTIAVTGSYRGRRVR